jgi:hypothetical protein
VQAPARSPAPAPAAPSTALPPAAAAAAVSAPPAAAAAAAAFSAKGCRHTGHSVLSIPSFGAYTVSGRASSIQGLTLVHFSAQCKRTLWDRGYV